MRQRIRIDPCACLLWAAILLILPLRWVIAWFIAAVFHEFCHWCAIRLMGNRLQWIHIGTGGAEMCVPPMKRGAELCCAAAGPLGSLFLLAGIRWMPTIALCAGIQGFFNLLPIYPLDGGRILNCIVGERIAQRTERIIIMLLLFASIWASIRLSLGIFPVLFSGMICLKALDRKIPCKRCK